jgi:hypothetical protein
LRFVFSIRIILVKRRRVVVSAVKVAI